MCLYYVCHMCAPLWFVVHCFHMCLAMCCHVCSHMCCRMCVICVKTYEKHIVKNIRKNIGKYIIHQQKCTSGKYNKTHIEQHNNCFPIFFLLCFPMFFYTFFLCVHTLETLWGTHMYQHRNTNI